MLAEFAPVRPCISNPVAILSAVSHSIGAQVVTNPSTVAVADCFDAVYSLRLRLLQFVFDHSTTQLDVMQDLDRVSLELMTSTLKPLGERLTAMQAGQEYEGQTAGPGLLLTRHVPLPRDPVGARACWRWKSSMNSPCDLAGRPPSRTPNHLPKSSTLRTTSRRPRTDCAQPRRSGDWLIRVRLPHPRQGGGRRVGSPKICGRWNGLRDRRVERTYLITSNSVGEPGAPGRTTTAI